MEITKHSIERAKERFGAGSRSAVHMINCAAERGKTSDEMPELERLYMENIDRNHIGTRTVYYNSRIYIFGEDDACVTMYPAPDWFFHRTCCQGKERVHNMKKYSRYIAKAV